MILIIVIVVLILFCLLAVGLMSAPEGEEIDGVGFVRSEK